MADRRTSNAWRCTSCSGVAPAEDSPNHQRCFLVLPTQCPLSLLYWVWVATQLRSPSDFVFCRSRGENPWHLHRVMDETPLTRYRAYLDLVHLSHTAAFGAHPHCHGLPYQQGRGAEHICECLRIVILQMEKFELLCRILFVWMCVCVPVSRGGPVCIRAFKRPVNRACKLAGARFRCKFFDFFNLTQAFKLEMDFSTLSTTGSFNGHMDCLNRKNLATWSS